MNEYSSKLSSATKRFLSLTPKDENPELGFLVRINGELTEGRRSQLQHLAIEIRSVAGDIIGMTAYLRTVPELAALRFVDYIEVAGPMYIEAKPFDRQG